MQAHGALEEAEKEATPVESLLNARTLLEASGLRQRMGRAKKRIELLRELTKLFILEARDNPKDSAYLLSCARDIYRRFKAAGGV